MNSLDQAEGECGARSEPAAARSVRRALLAPCLGCRERCLVPPERASPWRCPGGGEAAVGGLGSRSAALSGPVLLLGPGPRAGAGSLEPSPHPGARGRAAAAPAAPRGRREAPAGAACGGGLRVLALRTPSWPGGEGALGGLSLSLSVLDKASLLQLIKIRLSCGNNYFTHRFLREMRFLQPGVPSGTVGIALCRGSSCV